MLLICGLGNPGDKYQNNRHNIGFEVVGEFSRKHGFPSGQKKFKGVFCQGDVFGERVGLLLPLTYMNLSGDSLLAAAQFFKVSGHDILVVHDELDLPFGTLKMKTGGGAAGHNGLRSIIGTSIGSDFHRLRFGVGSPREETSGTGGAGGSSSGENRRVVSHVLGDWNKHEKPHLQDLIDRSVEGLDSFINNGMTDTQNQFNRKN